MDEEADDILRGGVVEAAKVTVQVIAGKIDPNSTRFQAAKWLLDNYKGKTPGPSPKPKDDEQENTSADTVEQMSEEEAEELLARVRRPNK